MAPERDLFANFERMRREIDELFGDFLGRPALSTPRRAGFTPAVDVCYTDDPPRAVVTAALPGISSDDLELEVQGRTLVIAGRRRPAESHGRVYQQIEIEHGPFRRVIQLGADVVPEDTRASYEDGILRIELPFAQPDPRSRSVPIEVGSREGRSEAAPDAPRAPGDRAHDGSGEPPGRADGGRR
ncbi:MAG: Hsp20/alpha crystallin family protein [Actinobacteria bacterium]|nr:MAG: Hsp20/alpha crystallin family protein [Actinomycetota bacterium]